MFPSRLYPGKLGYLIPYGVENRVRISPSTNSQQVGTIDLGGIFEILDGPLCSEGYIWYEVNYEGLVGWTVEGGSGEYWVAEFVVRGTPLPAVCEVFTTSAVNKRSGPSTSV